MSYLVNCKLAAVCILVLLILSYVYAIIRDFKKRPYISFTMLGIVLALSIGLILVFIIPQFRNIGFIGKIYEKIIDTFKNFIIASFIGRTTEWEMVPRMTNGIFSVIGFSSATGYSLITAYTSINGSTAVGLYDLHNAYVDFYAYHGIVGCIFLLDHYIFIGYLIYKLFKKSKLLALKVTMIFFVSIVFGMAETYRLFISMSANTFALNIMILGILLYELKDDKELFRIDNLIFSIFKRKIRRLQQMNKKAFLFLLVMPIILSFCSFKDKGMRDVRCENLFTLISDFDHRYPKQDDYMNFLKSGYYETFYYKQNNGYDCHYHFEYKNGKTIDEWGLYNSDGKTLVMDYKNQGRKNLTFSLYYSPTIDFHAIDTLEHDSNVYKTVYQARYIITAKG